MTSAARFGILGGTLDPVHIGHLEVAEAARRALTLDRVLIVPSRIPPHRPTQPIASRYHRFAMAALAIQGHDGLQVSDMELLQPGPTYTSETLARLHGQGASPAQIFFITGADAFAEIETWHRYPEVLEMANFVVVSRPGHGAHTLAARLPGLADRMQTTPPDLTGGAKTAIFIVNAATPDISSTDIRARVRTGASIAGLVPPAVEAYIGHHHLYRAQAAEPRLLGTADHLHGQD